jgi:hypothetical protein
MAELKRREDESPAIDVASDGKPQEQPDRPRLVKSQDRRRWIEGL